MSRAGANMIAPGDRPAPAKTIEPASNISTLNPWRRDMRILFFSTTFSDSSAPTRGTYNTALSLALQRKHQVRVISPRVFSEAYRGLRKRKFAPTLEVQQAGISVEYPTYWYTPGTLQHYYGEQMWWSVRRTLERAVRTFRPDAILSYWAHPDGAVGYRAGVLAGVPSAVIVGGTDVLILPKTPRRGDRVREVLANSDAVISVSEGLRSACRELGIDETRVHTIYQGIDPRYFNTSVSREDSRKRLRLADDGTAHLVWVGRLAPVKSVPTLLEAGAHLRDRGIRFQLHLLGDGPLRSELETQVQKLGLTDAVRFHGALKQDVIPDWYRAADLSVLSSDSEGLPNVLRESLACGTPFVSTDVGSIREIARPDYSMLVPPRDSLAFADAVESLLNIEAKEAAASYVPRIWSHCANETVQLFEHLIESRIDQGRSLVAPRRPVGALSSIDIPNVVSTRSSLKP
ncbi:glycosyltransferase [Planctomicrobium sp. SH668]|uniref:glycosyltransferase n=1 Tax=Planctomicrobium sp. SH668 TaxID=3448126 RepID=UPI003F5BF30B